MNRFIFLLIAVLLSSASLGQRKSYLVDTFSLKGWVVVDEVDHKTWMVNDSFFVHNKQKNSKIRYKLKSEGIRIIEPRIFDMLVDYDTIIGARVERIKQRGIMQKIHRGNVRDFEVVYSSGKLVCYKVKANVLLCMLLIKSELLAEVDRSDTAYTMNYALLRIE